MIEKEWIIRFCDSDETAFRLIFNKRVQKVFGYVHRYLRNRPDSEDLTQSIFLKLWEKRSLVDPDKPFDSFLFTVAYRSILDHLRTRSRLPRMMELDAETDFYGNSYLSAETKIAHQEMESFYSKALAELPEKRRLIFEMSRHQGLSNKEIADTLGISIA